MDAQLPDSTSAIGFRINVIERELADLKEQLNRYVPIRENELQLKLMRDTVERIERDIQQVKKQLEDLNSQLVTQQKEAQIRDAAQKESQAALQIKVLWGTVSTIIAILTSVLIGYLTHLFR